MPFFGIPASDLRKTLSMPVADFLNGYTGPSHGGEKELLRARICREPWRKVEVLERGNMIRNERKYWQ